ncbi:MAG: class I SAM-dependent methyltransferase [Candidatus Muirbacterium halophilum]|nr:class I SAM-dependent methyltransferase [Candidatus Muirbacterium halophilum]MCK9477368.1 class I SAM-dependent methyltransferase [Candidatus Muirbacterium halophilum]
MDKQDIIKKLNKSINSKFLEDINKRGLFDAVSHWDKKASHFDKKKFDTKDEQTYVKSIFDYIDSRISIKSDYSFLDVGAGTGILSIPLGNLSHKVTALDPSKNMLDILKTKSEETNACKYITLINKRWREAELEKDYQIHDIAIAHRSLGMISLDSKMNSDFNDAIMKLHNSAKKAVFIFFPGISDINTIISENLDYSKGKREAFSDFEVSGDGIYNFVYTLGFYPRVDYIEIENIEHFNNVDEAVQKYMKYWKLDAKDDYSLVLDVLKQQRILDDDGYVFDNKKRIKILWWKK